MNNNYCVTVRPMTPEIGIFEFCNSNVTCYFISSWLKAWDRNSFNKKKPLNVFLFNGIQQFNLQHLKFNLLWAFNYSLLAISWLLLFVTCHSVTRYYLSPVTIFKSQVSIFQHTFQNNFLDKCFFFNLLRMKREVGEIYLSFSYFKFGIELG